METKKIWGRRTPCLKEDFFIHFFQPSGPPFLAVGGYRGTKNEHYSLNDMQKDGPGCIQIWECSGVLTSQNWKESQESSSLKFNLNDRPRLAMTILHNFGVVWNLKWMPYGGYSPSTSPTGLDRLGILAGSFGDGFVRLFVIPLPRSLALALGVSPSEPIHVGCSEPLMELNFTEGSAWQLSWGGHTRLAIGSSFGEVGIWEIDELIDKLSRNKESENEVPLILVEEDNCFDLGKI